MDKFIIEGGRELHGTVKVSGAKNAALPILASTMLASGPHTISNMPEVKDVRTMWKLLEYVGAEIHDGKELHANFDRVQRPEAPYEMVKTMRASSLVLGPMLTRTGYSKVSLPGGCTIGERPLNMHIEALRSMGAEINLEHGYIEAKASRLSGARVHFDNVTVTGTENIMMAATLAEGETVIENAAREPEVADLALYLRKMGAKIKGAGTDRIIIEGVKELHASTHRIIPDRIEAGTFMIAAAITGGTVTIEDGASNYLDALTEKLRSIKVRIETVGTSTRVHGPSKVTSANITTLPYPGFATDLQAQFMALMCFSEGTSIITETIFENRFQHAPELKRLGADITIEGPTAVVKGVKKLIGAPVMATDLRASASLILAALAAEGTTEVNRIYHIDRGYERIEEKLVSLGANIKRA